LILWKKNKVGKTEINFIYDNSAANTYLNAEEESIFNYLTNHYFHQELSIIDLQNATNIPERKLSTIIKNKTGLNFKQFLNNLRLVEAKRLLKESDLQISEIAFKVGYGNASHFNRVFKASENCSPNDYRKENH
jgi:AraC-like DNA-binding protein